MVLVHGLFSSGAAWHDLVTLLENDLEVTERYDVLTFEYDSPKARLSFVKRIPSFATIADSEVFSPGN